MVQFKKQNNVVPVDFGEFSFDFAVNDINIKKLNNIQKLLKGEVSKYLDLISEGTEDDVEVNDLLDYLTELSHKSWDELFGNGAFAKVYAFVGETTLRTIMYLLEAIQGISEEVDAQVSTSNLDKYLKK